MLESTGLLTKVNGESTSDFTHVGPAAEVAFTAEMAMQAHHQMVITNSPFKAILPLTNDNSFRSYAHYLADTRSGLVKAFEVITSAVEEEIHLCPNCLHHKIIEVRTQRVCSP